MADSVTAALMQEAGQTRRAGDAVQARAQEAVAALNDPNLGAEDSPAQQQERAAAITQQGRIAGAPPAAAAPAPVAAPVPAPQQAANDPITAGLLAESKGGPDLSIPGNPEPYTRRPQPEAKTPTFAGELKEGPVGALEAALTVGTGILGGVGGAAAGLWKAATGGKFGTAEGANEAVRYAKEVAQSLTYEPRTTGGKEILESLGKAAEQTGASRLAGIGPAEGMALGTAIAAAPKRAVAQGARAAIPAGDVPPAGAPTGARGSVGAAGVNPKEAVLTLAEQAQTPQIKQVLQRSANKATPYTVQTAERVVDADSLPVPIKLTAGQSTQNPTLISQERNVRGQKAAFAERFNDQDVKLGENLTAIRDTATPDVYTTSRPAMAETIIDAYKTKDAALNKTISGNYKALKDANGGNFPMDAKAFVTAADDALHKNLKFEFVPGPLEKQLQAFRDGRPMSFEQFEAMRTNLANIARSQADGNVKQAAAIIRDSLEALPMPPGAEHLKPLADAARNSARERFALLEKDPAYKAVVRGRAQADKFLDKYVLNADTKAVETMKANLAHDATAQQTMTAGALRRLQDKATGNAGTFNAAAYNKALEGLEPKMGILFTPESKALVEKLGRVATTIKGQPPGSFVNNSNSAVALMGDATKFGLRAAADYAVPGAQLGTRASKMAGFVKEQMDLNRSLQTGAGLKLKEVAR